jgi:hypothetical protein
MNPVKGEGGGVMMTLRRLWRVLPRLRRECRVATGVIGLW